MGSKGNGEPGRIGRPPARPGKVTRKKSGLVLARSVFDVVYADRPRLVLDELDGFDGVIEWPV